MERSSEIDAIVRQRAAGKPAPEGPLHFAADFL